MRKLLPLMLMCLAIFLAVLALPAGVKAVAPRTVSLTEKEFSITPNIITVNQGETVQFVVTNAGTTHHSLTVELAEAKIEKDLFEPHIAPGTTRTASFTFTKAGTWEMYCPVADHKSLGMKGEIVVNAAPTTIPTTGASS